MLRGTWEVGRTVSAGRHSLTHSLTHSLIRVLRTLPTKSPDPPSSKRSVYACVFGGGCIMQAIGRRPPSAPPRERLASRILCVSLLKI